MLAVSCKVLRPYQTALIDDLRHALAQNKTPVAVVPTGGGKTVVFSRFVAEAGVPCVVVAHRKELVSQISRSLAAESVTHRVIAARDTVREICTANATMLGHSFVSPIAPVAAASVDTLKNYTDDRAWVLSVELVLIDEAHHLLRGNKWGDVAAMFPNATVVGFTATPERSDGKGLGAHADGLFDTIIAGPTMRELIDAGHLCPYRLFAPASAQLDLSAVPVSKATGDYSAPKLRATMKAAHITGDVVAHYLRAAKDTLGVTFVADVESAEEMAAAYREAGVPAEAVSAKTPSAQRNAAIKKFARRELLQLVNVDLFGEGFDLSSAAGMDVCIETVSMARPTHSYTVFAQQFGRGLRLGPGKEHATILDHVGNTMRHGGPPDFPRAMSLDSRKKRGKGGPDDMPKVRVCVVCSLVYERERACCPDCGTAWVPACRSAPDEVDGDLIELDPAVLAELHAKAAAAVRGDDEVRDHYSRMQLPPAAVGANVKRHRETREAQGVLRGRIAEVAGQWRGEGATDSQIYRRFYLRHAIDVASACGLKAAEARALTEKLNE